MSNSKSSSSSSRRRQRSNSTTSSSSTSNNNKHTKDASDLLNFRLTPRPNQHPHSQPPYPRSSSSSTRRRSSHIPRNRLPQGAFPLHASAQHIFYVSRIDTTSSHPRNVIIPNNHHHHKAPQQQQQQQSLFQYQGPDNAIPWKSVKMVKRFLVGGGGGPPTQESSSSFQHQCPICLDAFVCPRITKCGHVFCVCCLLQHLEHSKSLSYAEPKCPCCGISPICLQDLKPIEFQNVIPPHTSTTTTTTTASGRSGTTSFQKSSMKFEFVKLHRPKESFVPYLPQMGEILRSTHHQQYSGNPQKLLSSSSSSSSTTNNTTTSLPLQTDHDSNYCRFNFIDTTTYKQQLDQNLQELVRFEQEDCHSPVERKAVFEAMALVHQEQEDLIHNEVPLEQQQQQQQQQMRTSCTRRISLATTSSHLLYQTFQEGPLHTTQETQRTATTKCLSTSPPSSSRKLSIDSYDESKEEEEEDKGGGEDQEQDQEQEGNPESSTTITNTTNTAVKNRKQRQSQHNSNIHNRKSRRGGKHPSKKRGSGGSDRPAQFIPPTTMYLEDGSTHFYQSSDGQLCFLSGFNMKCLSTEFSIHSPFEEKNQQKETMSKIETTSTITGEDSPQPQPQQQQQHYKRPLPDKVEGHVVEVEHMIVTPDLRKRLAFLSHLPLWTDICVVELDLHRYLSDATRSSLKQEFDKRKSRRAKKKQAEKRADRVAQKAEEHRIEELKARYQTIDPNDEFFLPHHEQESGDIFPLDDSFGPSAASGGGGGAGESVSGGGSNSSGTTSRAVATANAISAPSAAFSFRAVATVNGANPKLADTSSAEAFPTLGGGGGGGSHESAQSPPKVSPSTVATAPASTWATSSMEHASKGYRGTSDSRGGGGRGSPPSFASAATRPQNNQLNHSPSNHATKGGRKGKGKKVVLFSTGGHRGTAF